MHMLHNTPTNAYRKVAVDARIRGARPQDLVTMCFEQVVSEITRAVRGHETGDTARRSDGLTRANAAITALEMGLDRTNPIAAMLDQLYVAAREVILSSVANFNREGLLEVRDDFAEIGAALKASAT